MKIKKLLDGNNVYFMSDLHYNHDNIRKLCNRESSCVEDMNKEIEDVLATLPEGAILFDLGDLFWRVNETEMKRVMSIPKYSEFYKVLGNHDKENIYTKSYVGEMITAFGDIIDIRVEYEGVVYPVSLSHYPMVSWNHKSRGGFMIHGHTHGNIDKYNEESPDLRVDVGMDSAISKENGSFLIPFSKIMEVMEKKAKGREFMKYVQEVRHNL